MLYFLWLIKPLVLSYQFLYTELVMVKNCNYFKHLRSGSGIQLEFLIAKEHLC